jgi:hypothetical protein
MGPIIRIRWEKQRLYSIMNPLLNANSLASVYVTVKVATENFDNKNTYFMLDRSW